MIKSIYYKSDLKQLLREPMMTLLFSIPIIIAPVFRLLLEFAVPFSQRYITYDITLYHNYILAFTQSIVASMLGVVMGFMLLDDKDAKIVELIKVTPLGSSGYLFTRLSFIAVGIFVYGIYSYLVVGIYTISIPILLYINILLGMLGATLGLIFIKLASDKVKGLIYAKGLNIIILFPFVDLLEVPFITVIAACFPTYWIYKIIESNGSFFSILIGTIVSSIWFGVLIRKEVKS